MSHTTAPIFPEGPVTPDTLAALLREARGFLRDATRDGQQLGMRIDEALSQWDRTTWCFPAPIFCGDISEADLALMSDSRPSYIVAVGDNDKRPTVTPLTFAQFYCTRCGATEVDAKRDGCTVPCPMAPLP